MFKYFSLIIFLFIADRLSKIYILQNPSFGGFQGGFFSLNLNQNIAFSLPLVSFLLYPLIIVILIVLSWLWYKNFNRQSILIWPLGFIIIGALSNLLDRINYGAVIDFINVPYFTVFNISDIYISIGVVWLFWHSWFYKKTEPKE